tara:strand:+ start:71 stop:280 length:210 start_codon:yes stop_codon:yes gene_type:complete
VGLVSHHQEQKLILPIPPQRNVDSIPSGEFTNTVSTPEPKKALDDKIDSSLLVKRRKSLLLRQLKSQSE